MEEEMLKKVLAEVLVLMREYAVFARFGDTDGIQSLDQNNVELRVSIRNYIEQGRTEHEKVKRREGVA